MTTTIIVNLSVKGIHFWKECPFEEVSYLRDPHRHTFEITAEKEVFHADRDVEIIMFQNELREYLTNRYHSASYSELDFGGMSCEMIAQELLERFDLRTCQVLEDGENGAKVYA